MNVKDWFEFNKCVSGPFYVALMRNPSMETKDVVLNTTIDKIDLTQLFGEYTILKVVPFIYEHNAHIKLYIFKKEK